MTTTQIDLRPFFAVEPGSQLAGELGSGRGSFQDRSNIDHNNIVLVLALALALALVLVLLLLLLLLLLLPVLLVVLVLLLLRRRLLLLILLLNTNTNTNVTWKEFYHSCACPDLEERRSQGASNSPGPT